MSSNTSDIENILKDLIKNPNKSLFRIIFKNLENWPFSLNSLPGQHTTRIAILDSSFNPPTNAHLTLLINSITNNYNDKLEEQFFHGSLLLYSVNNLDKILLSSDAQPIDRLIVMKILASCIIKSPQSINNSALRNIAVGVTTHGRFLDKANAIHSFFNNNKSSNDNNNISLYFIMGFDTIVRLFNPKYYNDIRKELGEFFMNNYVICANREGYDNDEMEGFLNSEIVKEIINNSSKNGEKKILRVILNDEISKISSTKVRELIKSQLDKETLPQVKFNELLYELSPKPIIDYYIQNQTRSQEISGDKI